jgi:hypothetical protein
MYTLHVLILLCIVAVAAACNMQRLTEMLADIDAHRTECASFVMPPDCAADRVARMTARLAFYHACRHSAVMRDASLTGLARLLNIVPPDKVGSIEAMIPYLTPWVIGIPEHPLVVTERPEPLHLDCGQSRYARALTGKPASTPSMVVDLIPFGYDLELLELHLLELYDVVDVFVLYEAGYTQQGVLKPLYFNESLHATPARWSRFTDKIIHMSPQTPPTAAQLDAARRSSDRSWYLENQMRDDPVAQFRISRHPLAVQARNQASTALLLQHDGDEIPSAQAVLHLSRCERKQSAAYYFPCTSYKLNTQWLQRTYDLAGLGREWGPQSELHNYLWRPGPSAIHLDRVFAQGSTGRGNVDSSTPDLGPGAAVHFSSLAEPVGGWLKRVGVVESHTSTQTSTQLRASMLTGTVSAGDLAALTDPWCERDYYISHVSTTGLGSFLYKSLPWALTSNPLRYPFVHPLADTTHCSYHDNSGSRCGWSAAGAYSQALALCKVFYHTVP